MSGDEIFKIILTSTVTATLSMIGTTAALKTDIKWLKTIIMSRPCMKNGKHCDDGN